MLVGSLVHIYVLGHHPFQQSHLHAQELCHSRRILAVETVSRRFHIQSDIMLLAKLGCRPPSWRISHNRVYIDACLLLPTELKHLVRYKTVIADFHRKHLEP